MSFTCLPKAFSILLGCQLQDIFDFIGHDGSERVWPELPEPFCYRAFHPQEMIDYALSKHNIRFVEIIPNPGLAPTDDSTPVPVYARSDVRMHNYLRKYDAVLCGTIRGRRHAVAWNTHEILDPNGTSYELERFSIETFYIGTEH